MYVKTIVEENPQRNGTAFFAFHFSSNSRNLQKFFFIFSEWGFFVYMQSNILISVKMLSCEN